MKFGKIKISIPVFGLGCGVLGLSVSKVTLNLGKYASTLLKALEYRGYDSTGAVIQDDKKNITLKKDVGAPSTLVKTLGIEQMSGKLFCGQVRWATFGTVTKTNAQPHWVKCKREIYGAHNGNITNTRELKHFLQSEGHKVVSDNDGEMLVHTIEHYFDIELGKHIKAEQQDANIRRKCLRQAIINASGKVVGSYAAVIVDPVSEYTYAIKAGSSLYFGIGTLEEDEKKFGLASSDLTAILKFTKTLVNLKEGEFVEFKEDDFTVYAFKDVKVKQPNDDFKIYKKGSKVDKIPVRSKLRAEDTTLLPEFEYFMQQEIYAEVESSRKLIKLFNGGSNTGKRMIKFLEKLSILETVKNLTEDILANENYEYQTKLFNDFINTKTFEKLFKKAKSDYPTLFNELVKEDFDKKYFFSSEKNTFIDLIVPLYDAKKLLLAKALDSIAEQRDVSEFFKARDKFLELIENTKKNNRNIYTIACGTSFHASKVAALFFNEIANTEIIPILPGDFRGQYSKTLKDNDVIIGVSQSGETKDLVDIFNYIDTLNLKIKKIVLVNNMNSTLGQEKSDVSIPIYCGPEIAVPATKSFINQITLFYYLAVMTAKKEFEKLPKEKQTNKLKQNLEKRIKSVFDIPDLIQQTIETTKESIEFMAQKIFMEPSMHILATKITGVAKEGALKIRETVLNHAEGGEASEFKHGPNTILGKNTVFGIKNIKKMFKDYNKVIQKIYEKANRRGISLIEQQKITTALIDYIFKRITPFNLSPEATKLFNEIISDYDFFENAYRNYPLIYVTGPDERDVNLTISQINTHKIRGADTFVIAEENEKLLENAKTNPHDEGYYGWDYIMLPKTGDSLMTAFSATIVLQLLALNMSIKKMKYLDKLGISDHGVHPDVPKNVSKSITVD